MRAFRNPKDNGGSLPARQAACAAMTSAPFEIGAGMAQLRVRHACLPLSIYIPFIRLLPPVFVLCALCPSERFQPGGHQNSVNSARPNGFSRAGGKTLRTLRKNSANSAVKIRKSHVGNPIRLQTSDLQHSSTTYLAIPVPPSK